MRGQKTDAPLGYTDISLPTLHPTLDLLNMLSYRDSGTRLCDGIERREWLRVGGLRRPRPELEWLDGIAQ